MSEQQEDTVPRDFAGDPFMRHVRACPTCRARSVAAGGLCSEGARLLRLSVSFPVVIKGGGR